MVSADASGVGLQSGTGITMGSGGAIKTALAKSGVVVADDTTVHTVGSTVVYTIVKAA